MSEAVHPVDQLLPLPKLFTLGLQHVLVMYANAVAVPLIIGGALHLPKDQLAMLINADLFACGIATLIQTVGFGPFGIRLPIIMGVTAVSISPMLAMAAMPGEGAHGDVAGKQRGADDPRDEDRERQRAPEQALLHQRRAAEHCGGMKEKHVSRGVEAGARRSVGAGRRENDAASSHKASECDQNQQSHRDCSSRVRASLVRPPCPW